MRTWIFAAPILVLSAAFPAAATDGNIALIWDPPLHYYETFKAIPCNCFATLYVYAYLQGASQTGITGAEYKIQVGSNSVADGSWIWLESFDPNATVLGSGALNPVDPMFRGVNVAWPSCQVGDGFQVLIEQVLVVNPYPNCNSLNPQTPLRLTAVKHDSPANQFFQCPSFMLCDVPVYTQVCLGSNLTLCRNPEPPFANNATCSTSGATAVGTDGSCTIAVQQRSWGAVKGLYRD